MTTYIYLYWAYGLYIVLYINHIVRSLSEDPKNVLLEGNVVIKCTAASLSLLKLFISYPLFTKVEFLGKNYNFVF